MVAGERPNNRNCNDLFCVSYHFYCALYLMSDEAEGRERRVPFRHLYLGCVGLG